jgi:hypothetical protein
MNFISFEVMHSIIVVVFKKKIVIIITHIEKLKKTIKFETLFFTCILFKKIFFFRKISVAIREVALQ